MKSAPEHVSEVLHAIADACGMTPEEVIAERNRLWAGGLSPVEIFLRFRERARANGCDLALDDELVEKTGRAAVRISRGGVAS